jgi:hypothetical protein
MRGCQMFIAEARLSAAIDAPRFSRPDTERSSCAGVLTGWSCWRREQRTATGRVPPRLAHADPVGSDRRRAYRVTHSVARCPRPEAQSALVHAGDLCGGGFQRVGGSSPSWRTNPRSEALWRLILALVAHAKPRPTPSPRSEVRYLAEFRGETPGKPCRSAGTRLTVAPPRDSAPPRPPRSVR